MRSQPFHHGRPMIGAMARWLLPLASLLTFAVAEAATTNRMPNWVCSRPETLFAHGFEAQTLRYVEPSNGSGGAFPGVLSRTVTTGFGVKPYYLYIPTSYTPNRPMPLLLALHGEGGPTGPADAAAQTVRNTWQSKAESGQFIVVAPVGSGALGGWIVPNDMPNDYQAMGSVLADVKAAYNIDGSRIYGWGFSAGGHVMHDLVLGAFSPGLNIDVFAGYGINAGRLRSLACLGFDSEGCDNLLASQPRRIPLVLYVGTSDPMRPDVEQDYARFIAAGWTEDVTASYTPFGGPHNYFPPQLSQIWDYLCPYQRLP